MEKFGKFLITLLKTLTIMGVIGMMLLMGGCYCILH